MITALRSAILVVLVLTSGQAGELILRKQGLGDGTLVLREQVRRAVIPLEKRQLLIDCDASDAILSRMRVLLQDRKWKDLIEQFGADDFSTWPADMADKASEAFHLRGQAQSFLKHGQPAEADLKAALQLAPRNPALWLTRADNYTNNLQDDEQALTAYRQAFAITGKSNGWQPLTATVAIARLLTDQVKTDGALAALKVYGDMEGMAPSWRIRLLRAYGHVYAAQGKEQESLAKFREALELESRQ